MNNSIETITRVQLGELCHVVTKGTTPTSIGLSFTDSGVPFLRIQNLSNKSVELENVLYVSEQTHQALKRSVIKPKDFLITIAGTIGKVAIVPDDFPECNCNQAVAILRFDYDKLNPQYLLHWLGTLDALRQISGRKVTATISNLSLGQIKQLKIPLPPLAEQQKIAAILDAADTLRQKDQQLIDHYTTLSQSLFLDMFGDPVTNPMGWEKNILKTIGSLSTGNTPPRANLAFYGHHIEWIKTNNINTPSMYLTPAEEYLSEEGLSVGRSVAPNSLLITCIAGSKKVIGNVAIADRKVAFNQQINSFSPFSGNILYFYYLFILGKKHIQSFSTGAMKGMISKSKFESIDFICPPINLQNQFAEKVKLIEAQKQQAQASLEHSEALFNSLLQRAFSGELTKKN